MLDNKPVQWMHFSNCNWYISFLSLITCVKATVVWYRIQWLSIGACYNPQMEEEKKEFDQGHTRIESLFVKEHRDV